MSNSKKMHASILGAIELQKQMLEIFKGDLEPDSTFMEIAVSIDDAEFLEVWSKLEASGKADDYESWVTLLRRFKILEIFKDKEAWPKKGQSNSSSKRYPLALNRLNGFMRNFRRIKANYSNAKMLAAICRNPNQGDIIHFVISYRQSASSVAIVAPIESECYSASYVWVSSLVEHIPDDWEKIFHFDPMNPSAVISKHRVWLREDVKRFYHVKALKTKGLGEVDNMWFNIREYIDDQVA
ncbi:MAG: hypothetical protein Q4F56_00760 [Candidatus Saccharibacteria bacterium]|nr:hypothetical protein [Candidatus Saccharibacteria bacterium]